MTDEAPNPNTILKKTGNLPGTFNRGLMTALNFDPIVNQGHLVVSDVLAGPINDPKFPYPNGYLRLTESSNRILNYDPSFEFVLYPKPEEVDMPPYVTSTNYVSIEYRGGATLPLSTIPPETTVLFMENDQRKLQIDFDRLSNSSGSIYINGSSYEMIDVQHNFKKYEQLFSKLYGVSIRPYFEDGVNMIELKIKKVIAGLKQGTAIQIPVMLNLPK
ncbi:MAG: hypothetical protein UR54_C0012G0007 [Candidatus Roizmanbacteria bacterium GW2011_GWA2_34_18]|uniref:Uncharacterized protein n=1 Tax=Candidatus Roizmanbacteria bacterium GW2011_GWA2_34_18 TaxID=1618477 RepID=A0A0G0DZ83_9BACT|nr:MAG: hypothetical protein UR54_C0012G0007 [Candidatus Roizmanbacteria bacterium GW2011_GWA2_34_18]